MQGQPKNPEDHDDYFKNRGPTRKFHNDFGCIQDVVSYKADDSALGKNIFGYIAYLKGNVNKHSPL